MCKGRRSIDGDFPARGSYGMFRSVNGGITWDTINTGLSMSLLNVHCIAIQPNNANTVYIGTWKDGVYKTTNGGTSWSPVNTGLGSADVRSLTIHPTDTSIVYAGTVAAGIFVSTDAGGSWTSLNTGVSLECPQYLQPIGGVTHGASLDPPPRFLGNQDYYLAPWTSIRSIVIDPSDPSKMYAADYNSGVYASTNSGAEWVEMNDSLTMRTVNKLALSADGSVLYAATFGGGVFRLPIGQNHPPQIAVTFPPADSVLDFPQTSTIDLCVTAFDLDNDQLTYAWYLDGGPTGGTSPCTEFIGAGLTAGYHVIEVTVSDGNDSTVAMWELDVVLDVEEREDPQALPDTYALDQNYPNPFNPATTITFSLPVRSHVQLVVFNVMGQQVRSLVDGDLPAGEHQFVWNGDSDRGKAVASGVYLYRIRADSFQQSRKMLLLK
jgi:hypothetical protein